MIHRVFILYSQLPGGRTPEAEVAAYLNRLSAETGDELQVAGETDTPDEVAIVFAASGGTASSLKKLYDRSGAKRWILLSQGEGNTLSASMQMATFLKERGVKYKVIFGSAGTVSLQLKPYLAIIRTQQALKGLNIGAIGTPSEWLIANDTDRAVISARFGVTFEDIAIHELEEAYHDNTYECTSLTQAIIKQSFNDNETQKSLNLYGALKRVCSQHHLGALSLRCFDLLTSIQTAGCVALALLNAEGIVAGCEGDMPSLVSMLLLGKLTGQPAFMCNPSRMDESRKEMIFAHCTLPLNMADSFSLTTHFESESSVAVRGELPAGPVTVFKLSADGARAFVSNGVLLDNPKLPALCRTQIHVRLEEDVDQMFISPVGNHFLVCRGAHRELIRTFLDFLQ